MTIIAGSVVVDDVGNATGGDLARALYDEQVAAMNEIPDPPPKGGSVATRQSLARNSNHTANALAAYLPTALGTELLLLGEPVSVSTTYSNMLIGSVPSHEVWQITATSKTLKTIDYSYSTGNLITEVRKVYAADGTTVIAQLTINYSYTGSIVTGKTLTRDT
jgi:hypothetical protein